MANEKTCVIRVSFYPHRVDYAWVEACVDREWLRFLAQEPVHSRGDIARAIKVVEARVRELGFTSTLEKTT